MSLAKRMRKLLKDKLITIDLPDGELSFFFKNLNTYALATEKGLGKRLYLFSVDTGLGFFINALSINSLLLKNKIKLTKHNIPIGINHNFNKSTKLIKGILFKNGAENSKSNYIHQLNNVNHILRDLGIKFKKGLIINITNDKEGVFGRYMCDRQAMIIGGNIKFNTVIRHEIGHAIDWELGGLSNEGAFFESLMNGVVKDEKSEEVLQNILKLVKESSLYRLNYSRESYATYETHINSYVEIFAKYVTNINSYAEIFANGFEAYIYQKMKKRVAEGILDPSALEDLPEIFITRHLNGRGLCLEMKDERIDTLGLLETSFDEYFKL